MDIIKIGTRGSKLALWQANHIKFLIESKTNHLCSIHVISTKGDIDLETPLPEVGDKGFFTAEIEDELIKQNIDLAVHSTKDLPTKLNSNFIIGAIPKRGSYRDSIICNSPINCNTLLENSTIATGSIRRKLQLKSLFKNVNFVDIRGNIGTRISKLVKNNWDGVIMAEAAINRLNLDINYYSFSSNDIIPAAGQGAIAVQITKKHRQNIDRILKAINHKPTYLAVEIEREIVDALEGGCKTPIGCLATIRKNQINVIAYLSNMNGTKSIRISDSYSLRKKDAIINGIVNSFMEQGAKEIVEENRNKLNV